MGGACQSAWPGRARQGWRVDIQGRRLPGVAASTSSAAHGSRTSASAPDPHSRKGRIPALNVSQPRSGRPVSAGAGTVRRVGNNYGSPELRANTHRAQGSDPSLTGVRKPQHGPRRNFFAVGNPWNPGGSVSPSGLGP